MGYEEDSKKFSKRLMDFYEASEDVSYQRLVAYIRKRLSQLFQGTRSDLRPLLENDIDDLIEETIERLVRINAKPVQKGGEIENIEAMATTVAGFIYKEALRDALKPRPLVIEETDSPDGAGLTETTGAADGEIEQIEMEIKRECYKDCLKKLPEEIQTLFAIYYTEKHTSPEELADLRMGLAEAQGAAGAQPKRKLNNLQKKVWEWREKKLKDCVLNCFEGKTARHARLAYLKELKTRKTGKNI